MCHALIEARWGQETVAVRTGVSTLTDTSGLYHSAYCGQTCNGPPLEERAMHNTQPLHF